MGRGGARRPSRKDFVLLREDAAAEDIFDPEVKRIGALMHLATRLRQRVGVSESMWTTLCARAARKGSKIGDTGIADELLVAFWF